MHNIKAKIEKPDDSGQRNGKGFSKGEIKKAGSNPVEARKIGLPVDPRRRTIYDKNVEAAKTLIENEKAKAKPKPQATQPTKKEKSKS